MKSHHFKSYELTNHLSEISDGELLNANRLVRQDQLESLESFAHQRGLIRSNGERKLAEVVRL